MRRSLRPRPLAATIAIALFLPASLALAADTDNMLPTVEVTTSKIAEPVDSTPAMITVISGEELRARNVQDLRQALSLVGGVDIAPGGDAGPAGSVPGMWGLREFDAFLLVVDGIPSGGAFNPALTTLDLTNVERIEVLRGPAPVMYGATSFVGCHSRHPLRCRRGAVGSAGGPGFAQQRHRDDQQQPAGLGCVQAVDQHERGNPRLQPG
jgi:outer membrane receptor protein involved in Fe transport